MRARQRRAHVGGIETDSGACSAHCRMIYFILFSRAPSIAHTPPHNRDGGFYFETYVDGWNANKYVTIHFGQDLDFTPTTCDQNVKIIDPHGKATGVHDRTPRTRRLALWLPLQASRARSTTRAGATCASSARCSRPAAQAAAAVAKAAATRSASTTAHAAAALASTASSALAAASRATAATAAASATAKPAATAAAFAAPQPPPPHSTASHRHQPRLHLPLLRHRRPLGAAVFGIAAPWASNAAGRR